MGGGDDGRPGTTLYYFAAVVEHGGFASAGRALGIPKSKLSRRVALIEDRLGVHLIHRTTRQFVVTDVGRSFYQHCQAMVVDAEAAMDTIGQFRAEPRGLLRVACPVSSCRSRWGRLPGSFWQDIRSSQFISKPPTGAST